MAFLGYAFIAPVANKQFAQVASGVLTPPTPPPQMEAKPAEI